MEATRNPYIFLIAQQSVMKGVVLAGGKGTRLRPMTHVVNKHILPVYDEPMIFYPVKTLLDNGVEEIMIISGPQHIGHYIQLLEDEFEEAEFTYRVQKEPKGIAHAVGLAEEFVDDRFAVILGDNILIGDFQHSFEDFEGDGAQVFLKKVDHPARYGIAEVEGENVVGLEEKPDDPSSEYAVIGMYLFPGDVFDKIRDTEPSDRGEMEITDVNRKFMEEGRLAYEVVDQLWFDAGTPEGLFEATKYVREHKLD